VASVHLHPEPFSVENTMMTPTFKLKRPQAQAAFQEAIDGACRWRCGGQWGGGASGGSGVAWMFSRLLLGVACCHSAGTLPAVALDGVLLEKVT
jgi:hypothetical protein